MSPISDDRRIATATGGGEPAEDHVLANLQAGGHQGGADVVAQDRLDAFEGATDMRTGQANHTIVGAGAGGGEPAAEVHALADLQVVGDQGGAGVVAQDRPVALEVAADVGTDQADRAAAGTGGSEPEERHGPADLQTIGGQGRAGVVAQDSPRRM